MRRLYLIILMTVFTFSCYDDKGNYDYGELDKLEIKLPMESYELLFGEKLPIIPTIITAIPEEDLAYDWEFYGKNPKSPENWWKEFVSVYQGKVLDYTCLPDEYLLTGEGTYDLRLNVTQLSTGRHFYSKVVRVKLDFQHSHTGIMVFHGDDNFSDIGIVVAEEFKMKEPTSEVTEMVVPSYYSDMNGGEKIEGKGQWLKQMYPKNGVKYSDYIQVVAVTDKSSVVTNSKSFVKEGDWNSLFNGGLNKGEPQACFINSMYVFVMDGGAVFKKMNSKPTFAKPMYDPEYSDVLYDFYPKVYIASTTNRLLKGMVFDRSRRGFVAITGVFNNFNQFAMIDVNEGDVSVRAPFNPANMEADLVYMAEGGASKSVLAVMEQDDSHSFLVELDMGAANFATIPRYKYELTHLSGVRDAIAWEFVASYINMCYYATPTAVYRFSVDGGQVINPEYLVTETNEKVQFEGTITMMKILKQDYEPYYKSGEVMVVGTYGGTPGSGKLYSLMLDRSSGRVKSIKMYSGFDRICDVGLKGW